MAAAIHPLCSADALLQVWGPALSWILLDASWGKTYEGTVGVRNYSSFHCSSYGGCNWYALSPSSHTYSKFTSLSTNTSAGLSGLPGGETNLTRGWNIRSTFSGQLAAGDLSNSQLGKGVTRGVPYIFLSEPSCNSSSTSSYWSGSMISSTMETCLLVCWPLYKASSNYLGGSYSLVVQWDPYCILEKERARFGDQDF